MKIRFVLIIVFIRLIFINSNVYSDDEELRVKGFCYTIESYINALTLIIPTQNAWQVRVNKKEL